jgi:transcriptional regulator with XRE-family HTH domain
MDKKYTTTRALALRIAELLTQQGISQYELAKRSILAETTISGIMNERWKTTTLSTIERISDGFGLSISQFLNSPLFDHDKFNN